MSLHAGLIVLGLTLTVDAQLVRERASDVLENPAYGFCNDEDYPLSETEAEWCPVVGESNEICPEYPRACKNPRAVFAGGPGPLGRRERGAGEPPSERTAGGGPDRHRDREVTVSQEESVFARFLFWFIIAAIGVGAVVAIAFQLRRGSAPLLGVKPGPDPDIVPGELTEAEREQIEKDVQRLLARARSNAQRGAFAAAIADSHAALLRRLDEDGRIHMRVSRTNGDYVRELESEGELQRAARDVVGVVERVQFGGLAATRELFEQVFARVLPVASRGAVIVLAALGWSSVACDGDREQQYPWASSPSGSQAVIELLKASNIEARYRTEPLQELPEDGPGIVLMEKAQLTSREWDVVLSHVRDGSSLLVASAEDLPDSFGIRSAAESRESTELTLGPWRARLGELDVAAPGERGLVVANSDAVIVLETQDHATYGVALPHGLGEIVVLADDRLLQNGALPVADNAAFVVGLMRELGQEVELIDAWNSGGGTGSYGSENAFAAVDEAGLTLIILQLLVLIALLYLWRGVHFGRPRDPPPPSRRLFTDHVRALALQYQRSGASRHALGLYAGWALERLGERSSQRRRGLYPLAQRLAARSGRDEAEIMQILVEAHGARDPAADNRGTAHDLRVLRELSRLIHTHGGSK